MAEDRRRGKGGGGSSEKVDTPMFGPQRMKDNRIIWDWDEL